MLTEKDLSKLSEPPQSESKPEKQTLLSKYEIPVHNLDFSYVEKCQNGKELEKILKILKSGEEGYFPQLVEVTERKLAEIRPNSKLLRKLCPVLNKNQINKADWEGMSNDLVEWVEDITEKDQELQTNKSTSNYNNTEVRKTQDEQVNDNTQTNPKRIAATDYASWDKYDPDTEILKIDLEEEKIKKTVAKNQKEKSSKPKSVRFNDFTTEAEAVFEANREKERGNDCFKAKEYAFALQHYTNSLQCKQSAIAYTNRAVTYNKLAKYKLAINDCKAALKLEPQNFKAFLRMAQAYDALQQHDEALNSIEQAIEIDPNSAVAQQLANRLQNVCNKQTVTKRFAIEDVNTSHVTQPKPIIKPILRNYEVIPIPGTSKMGPPYTKILQSTDANLIKYERWKINAPHLLHITTIDTDSDEDCSTNLSYEKEIINKTSRTEAEEIQLKQCIIKEEKTFETECRTVPILNKTMTQRCKQEIQETDSKAGGDFHDVGEQQSVPTIEELHSPFSFMQNWNSAKNDINYTQRAEMLKKLNFKQIHEVIGYKLDDTILSTIIECLHRHFTVAGEVDTVFSALTNITRIPRFKTILLFLKEHDWKLINNLIEFLNQHGSILPDYIRDLYCNNE